MKLQSARLVFGLLSALAGCSVWALAGCSTSTTRPIITPAYGTKVEVVEMKHYSFTANGLLGQRKNVHYIEIPAAPKYRSWADDAIRRVNQLLPPMDRLPKVKINLVFCALLSSPDGHSQRIPISIIDSYEESQTNSMRLGMNELKNDKIFFQMTVAHEYAHLVFENASRKAGTTPKNSPRIKFWPKPVYEGVADLVASLAFRSPYIGSKGKWFTRNLNQFQTLKEAKAAKNTTTEKAQVAFRKMHFIPQYSVYRNWLSEVSSYVKLLGGSDPYAQGDWLAGSLLRKANTISERRKLVAEIIERAKTGEPASNIRSFRDGLIKRL